MNYVWIVGGSVMQLPMYQEVKKRGYAAIVSDRNKDCFLKDKLDSNDKMLYIDTYDTDAHVKAAKELCDVSAVVAPGVDVGPTVSAIAETLNLHAVPYRVAVNVRDKAMMRLLTGFKHPANMLVHSATTELYRRWVDTNPLPIIIKPVDNCGSRGINVVSDETSYVTSVKSAMSANKRSSGVLLEEMLHGSEYALDFLIVDGEALWVNGVTRLFRHHRPGKQDSLFGIEGAIINPFIAPKELCDLATVAARRLQVTEGPFKIDAILDDRYGWCILECATRWSGGFDHMYLAPLVGRDITSVLLDYALGLTPQIPEWPHKVFDNVANEENDYYRFAASYVPYYEPMKVRQWKWAYTEEELDFSLGIKHVFIRATDEIKDLKDCAERPAFFLATGHSKLEALRFAYQGSRYVIPVPEL